MPSESQRAYRKLQKLDPRLEVIVTSEDPDGVVPGYQVWPFEIHNVSAFSVELSRDEARRRQIAEAPEGEGRNCAIIEIIADV